MESVKLKIKLIRMTDKPEETVALAAKLCYSERDIDGLTQVAARDAAEFIARLVTMGHLSPFEHASFTYSVEGVSRALLAQITRHRIASFSVRSQRYVKEKDFKYIIPPAIEALGSEAADKYAAQMQTLSGWYAEWEQRLGGKGESSNEDARFILPNAAETRFIVTMNARELLHFFSLRCCNRAQWEIRALAWEMLRLASKAAPSLFVNAGPPCVSGACTEGKMTCGKAKEVKEKIKDIK